MRQQPISRSIAPFVTATVMHLLKEHGVPALDTHLRSERGQRAKRMAWILTKDVTYILTGAPMLNPATRHD